MNAAARQARYRERQRRGEAVYPVTVDHEIFWALVDGAGLLREADMDNRAAIERALTAALADWAAHQKELRVTLIAGGRR